MRRRLFGLIGVALVLFGYSLLMADPNLDYEQTVRNVMKGEGLVVLGAVFVAAALFWERRR